MITVSQKVVVPISIQVCTICLMIHVYVEYSYIYVSYCNLFASVLVRFWVLENHMMDLTEIRNQFFLQVFTLLSILHHPIQLLRVKFLRTEIEFPSEAREPEGHWEREKWKDMANSTTRMRRNTTKTTQNLKIAHVWELSNS